MILRKLADGIRNQDWFTVAIELIVVVAGILIAVQVDRFVEGRREAALAQTYVERLLVDLAQNKERYEDSLRIVARKIDALEEIRRILSDVGAEPERGSVVGIVRDSTIFGWVNPMTQAQSPTFSEMIAAGNLDILQDADLKAELLSYYGRLERDSQRVDQRQTDYPRVVQKLAPPSVVTLRATFSPSELAEAASSVDVEGMISRLRAGGLVDHVDAELTYAMVLEQQLSYQLLRATNLEQGLTEL